MKNGLPSLMKRVPRTSSVPGQPAARRRRRAPAPDDRVAHDCSKDRPRRRRRREGRLESGARRSSIAFMGMTPRRLSHGVFARVQGACARPRLHGALRRDQALAPRSVHACCVDQASSLFALLSAAPRRAAATPTAGARSASPGRAGRATTGLRQEAGDVQGDRLPDRVVRPDLRLRRPGQDRPRGGPGRRPSSARRVEAALRAGFTVVLKPHLDPPAYQPGFDPFKSDNHSWRVMCPWRGLLRRRPDERRLPRGRRVRGAAHAQGPCSTAPARRRARPSASRSAPS